MVINKGVIVERGPVSTVMHEPSHPYTSLLLDSIPQPDPELRWKDRITVDELAKKPVLDDSTEGAPVI
ncbi:hypothetical protein GCM10009744_40490 [Kribbella alba]|uniref:Oligopeptide/dipeptide ABC transporter C-terminal domain-containing protein n=1 Tax=Kribbella alba TaxID=190197 RepID=A0ABN2FH52_9ACTN